MRILGFSVPLIVLIIGAYFVGVKFPGLGQKVLSKVPTPAS